jgi:hypothetical protein
MIELTGKLPFPAIVGLNQMGFVGLMGADTLNPARLFLNMLLDRACLFPFGREAHDHRLPMIKP